jgi:hypothetical protein
MKKVLTIAIALLTCQLSDATVVQREKGSNAPGVIRLMQPLTDENSLRGSRSERGLGSSAMNLWVPLPGLGRSLRSEYGLGSSAVEWWIDSQNEQLANIRAAYTRFRAMFYQSTPTVLTLTYCPRTAEGSSDTSSE